MRLKDRVAVVTGGSRGIGLACAGALAREGARLCLVSTDAAPLEAAADQLRAGGARVLAVSGSVADEALAPRLFAQAEDELGPVEVLVNNAGVLEVGPVAEFAPAAWDRTLDVNLKGCFLFAREAVRRMVPRRSGRIISISSISGSVGTPRLAAYCASKWGLNGLIKALAEELRGTGVLSMGVAPGSVDTEMLRKSGFPPDMKPEEIASVVLFLATDAPAGMQGSIVEVFG